MYSSPINALCQHAVQSGGHFWLLTKALFLHLLESEESAWCSFNRSHFCPSPISEPYTAWQIYDWNFCTIWLPNNERFEDKHRPIFAEFLSSSSFPNIHRLSRRLSVLGSLSRDLTSISSLPDRVGPSHFLRPHSLDKNIIIFRDQRFH